MTLYEHVLVWCLNFKAQNEVVLGFRSGETSPCNLAQILLKFPFMERTLWHSAAVQAFGNELEDNRKDLAIEAEV